MHVFCKNSSGIKWSMITAGNPHWPHVHCSRATKISHVGSIGPSCCGPLWDKYRFAPPTQAHIEPTSTYRGDTWACFLGINVSISCFSSLNNYNKTLFQLRKQHIFFVFTKVIYMYICREREKRRKLHSCLRITCAYSM